MSQHDISTPQGCGDLSQLSLEELRRREQELVAQVAKHQEGVSKWAKDIHLCEWYRRMRERGFTDMEPLLDDPWHLGAMDWSDDSWEGFFDEEEPRARSQHFQCVELLKTSEAQLERVQRELQKRKTCQTLPQRGGWVLGNAQWAARPIAFGCLCCLRSWHYPPCDTIITHLTISQ